jgi:hypothetical protein
VGIFDQINKGTGKLFEFNSWGDMLEYVKQPLPDNAYWRESVDKGDADWSGTATYPQALTVAVDGWQDAVKDAKQLADALINKVMDRINVPVIHYDVEGIDFEMSRVNRGEPECWYRFEEHITNNEGDNVITIVVNGAVSCGIKSEAIIRRGAVICALIELLEYSHRKVTVVHDMPYHNEITFRTIVKTAHQPLDMARLMFACGHPAMLRRLMFHALELNPTEHEKVGSGYSIPTDTNKANQGDIYFPRMISLDGQRWHSEPEQFIIEQLKAQGIEIKNN